MTACRVCATPLRGLVLDLGPQPVTKNLLRSTTAPDPTHGLAMAQCPRCTTIQLVDPFPAAALVAAEAGVTSREPEGHLDAMVETLCGMLSPTARIVGVSSKEDTTLERFRRRGYANTYRLDPRADLGIDNPKAYVESIQKALTAQRAAAIVAQHGSADCVIVRHILEHAEAPKAFVDAVASLVKPGGLVMFEIPDCEASLAHLDYTMIWEEHVAYFTARTYRALFARTSLREIAHNSYAHPYENLLVFIGRREETRGGQVPAAANDDVALFDSFVTAFPGYKADVAAALQTAKDEGRQTFLYGAGHLAVSFVNYLGLAKLIDFVVDDAPEKQNAFLPGSRIPVMPSQTIESPGPKACILGISPDREHVLAEKLTARFGDQLVLYSIFNRSPRSFRKRAL
jgi:hypothetical protein